ncbi:MAG: KTSC domain-containing protein [Gaiellaceae bacterium]
MRRESVSSRAIKTVGYRKGTLEIEFPDGDVYRYFGVPRFVFLQLLRAESMGAFFNERIRDSYRCEGPR